MAERYDAREFLLRRTAAVAIVLTVFAFSGNSVAHESGPQEPSTAIDAQSMMGGQGHQMMHEQDQGMMSGMHRLMMPQMDPAEGRKLFASKGCVACHAVNGVGGHDATPLDAHTMKRVMNPFDFAAKMWRMAPAMIAAQEEAIGEQILFTGAELANIVAFVHHDEEQHKFSESDIPPEIRKWMDHSHGNPGGGANSHGAELGHNDDDHHEHGVEKKAE